MISSGWVEKAARALFESHGQRERYGDLPVDLRPRDLDQAYAVQAAFQRLLTPTKGTIAGYKIALTSQAMQAFVGIHHPLWGAICARTVHTSPARLASGDFMHLGIECEVAVRLGRDLPAEKAPFVQADVAAAIETCMPAFELVDDRHADYRTLEAFGLVADNAWNAGIVLGPPMADWRSLDLSAANGWLTVNGAAAGEGLARDALGHPIRAAAWLANGLAERERELKRGMVVMTGSIVTTKFLVPGDQARFEVAGLGAVEVSVA
ncbi:MAG: hydratase [Alphaproteobacteria bacterium]|nr:hydratase [Alphaproteobacteria bacterium]